MPRKLPQDDVKRKGDPYSEGYEAHSAGKPLKDNPYKGVTWHKKRWADGWNQSKSDSMTMM